MPLTVEMAYLLEGFRRLPKIHNLSPMQAREAMSLMRQGAPPGPAIHSVEDRSIPTPSGPMGVRIYHATERPTGLLVYYHGGGWVMGSLDASDAQVREFALQTGCCIVSVDYRLAPEHPFPAAVTDAVIALSWAHAAMEELCGRRVPLLVGGDSAGANLAAVTAILARDSGGPALAGQLLFYPVTDAVFDTPSYDENAEGFFLTRDLMRWFWNHYVPDGAQRLDFRCAPLRAGDLSRLPPALIQTAEFDPLRDEGEEYGSRLRAAGSAVVVQRHLGLIHGYFAMTRTVPAANAAVSEASKWVIAAIAAAANAA